MMDCGNCGYWKFEAIERRFAVGLCMKIGGPHYPGRTPYSLQDKCWGPEGGRGPRSGVCPPLIYAD